ncbi:MAG: DUF302 domain-containing protein [Gammaproteobacteria bacterium]|nr:MAG: DUF302 domain-containing protein [Gammaproteobacteria bacterium]
MQFKRSPIISEQSPLLLFTRRMRMIKNISPHSVAETMDKLEAAIKEKGIPIVARVNHAAAAHKADLQLRPTEILIFGNPLLGTPLMQSSQSISLDLPLRIAVWEDESGTTKIAYHDPGIVTASHGITDKNEIVAKMTTVLEGLVNTVSK